VTLLDHIIDTFLPSGRSFLAKLRGLLLSSLRPIGLDSSRGMIAGLRRILANAATGLTQQIKNPLLGSWLGSTYDIARDAHADADGDGLPPTRKLLWPDEAPDPRRGYTFHERGLDWLHSRRVVTSDMLRNVDAAAMRNAEVIAHATTEETARRLTDALDQSVREGGTIRNFKQAVGEAFDSSPLSDSQMETLYRTNGGRAYAAGAQSALSHPLVGSEFPYVLYTAVHDSRNGDHIPGLPCPTHRMMEQLGQNGTAVYRVNDPVIRKFWPPWRWNCFLPGTEIQGRVTIGLRSAYTGQAVEMTSRSGKRLRVTANHPILTPDGFRAAGVLSEGDKVVSYQFGGENGLGSEGGIAGAVGSPDKSRFPAPLENEQHKPVLAEDVFRLLADRSSVVRMPIMPDDFHGDAMGGDGYVDVVAVNRELLDDIKTSRAASVGSFSFAGVNRDATNLASDSHSFDNLTGLWLPPHCIPSLAALPGDGGGVSLQGNPLRSLSVGLASQLNASRYKILPEGCSANTEFLGELIDGGAGSVFFDEIAEIRKFDFEGHVYDFQTEGGWVSADGIIASNCRCHVIPLNLADAARHGSEEARHWLETGREPNRPLFVAHPPFELPKGWIPVNGWQFPGPVF
jgi:hypothetical protein